MAPLQAALFDIDGTLVDSNDAHAHAWVDALAEARRPVPFAAIRPLIGMGGDNLLPKVAGLSAEDGPGKRISERRGAIFLERYLPHLKPFPGARDLVLRVKAQGLKVAVATSSDEEAKTALLDKAGVADLFDAETSADDADRSKPDPDIVQAALTRLRLPAREAVMIGDTPYDVEAAARAGVRTIGFRCGGWDGAGLRGALEVYDGPADLLARFADSVLARESVALTTR
jgi:HAD superfamily hydrolase (TIGR01509 family)